MLTASRRRAPLVLLGLAVPLATTLFAACGSSARQGQSGDSCTKTDDCVAPLACRSSVCVGDGAGATSGTTSSTSSTGAPGGSGAGGKGGSGGMTSTSSSSGTPNGGAGGAGHGGSGGAGGSGTSSSGAGGTGAAGGSGGGAGGNGLDPVACAACVESQCKAEAAACDAACLAIQACLETVCAHLGAIGSPEEGACQVDCQNQHAAAKAHHLALVNCAASASCAPCSSYPWDYDACVAAADAGACAATRSACEASADCTSYRSCVATCATLADCLACGSTPAGQAGAPLLLDHQQCLAGQCIEEAWLP
jgi:hypothetical protein